MPNTLRLNLSRYFPFLLNTVKYKPLSITLSLTYRCNSRCIMCNYWDMNGDAKSELSTVEVRNILCQADKIGIKNCTFYGGEPLLRKDIFELVACAHSLGIKTSIITNGLLLDKGRAQRLIENGLNSLKVSIDAVGEEFDRIRGIENAYKRVYTNLEGFVRLSEGSDIDISIASLLMLPTLKNDNLLKVIDVADQLKISVIIQLLTFSLFYLKDKDGETGKKLWITDNYYEDLNKLVDRLIEIKKGKPGLIVNSIPALKYIKQYFNNPKSKGIPCYIAYGGRIWVDPKGKVFSCQGLPVIGDLRKETLEDIINSERWKERLKKMFRKECAGCTCMYDSNIDAHLPLAWKNILKRKFLAINE